MVIEEIKKFIEKTLDQYKASNITSINLNTLAKALLSGLIYVR